MPAAPAGDDSSPERLLYEIHGQLLAGFIHELNNPLGVVMGYAQEAIAGIDANPATFAQPLRDDLSEVVSECRRMAGLLAVWRQVLRRDESGLDDNLRRTGGLVRHLVTWQARGKLELPDLPVWPLEPGGVASDIDPDAWRTALPPATQIEWWVLVLRWVIEQHAVVGRRMKVSAALENDLLTLRCEPAASKITPLAARCELALDSLAARHSLPITIAPGSIAFRLR